MPEQTFGGGYKPPGRIRNLFIVSLIALFIASTLSFSVKTNAADTKTYGTNYFTNEYAQGSINIEWDENSKFYGYKISKKYTGADTGNDAGSSGTEYYYTNTSKSTSVYFYLKDAILYQGKTYDAKVYTWTNMPYYIIRPDSMGYIWFAHPSNTNTHAVSESTYSNGMPAAENCKINIQIEIQGLSSFKGVTSFTDLDAREAWSCSEVVSWYKHSGTNLSISGTKVTGTIANDSTENIHLTMSTTNGKLNFVYYCDHWYGGHIISSDTYVRYKIASNSAYKAGSTIQTFGVPYYSNYTVLSHSSIEGLSEKVTVGTRTYKLKAGWFSNSTASTAAAASYKISTSPKTLYATYYKLWNVTTSISNGTITATENAIEPGSSKKVTWTPNSGYYVSEVKIDGVKQSSVSVSGGSYTFSNITSDHTVSVVCRPYHTVTTKVTHGTITKSGTKLKDGANYNVEYSPDNGYYLKSVTVDGKAVDIKTYPASYKFSSITSDHTIEVVYAIKPTVTLTKRIAVDDIYFEHGDPTFLFKVEGTDVFGDTHTYYQSMEFDKTYVDKNSYTGADGKKYVDQTVTFDSFYGGKYTASEVGVSRYTVDTVSNVTSGTAKNGTAVFDLTNSASGKATFTNAHTVYRNYSHDDSVINEITATSE